MDEFEQGIDRAQKKFKSFSDNISGLSGKIDSAYKGMGDVLKPAVDGFKAVEGVGKTAGNAVVKGLGGFAAASTAVAGFGTAAVKSGMQFDATMSEVSAISGATGEEFDALRDKALEMGAKTKFSASEAGEAMTYMAMAGWKSGDMIDGIAGIMNLAAASGEDLATTSDIVTDALTALGMQASDSGHFADVLAAASSNANTNVSLMGETFKYAAPLAGAMGYTAEDTALAIGLMANAGIKGSQSGTALRSIMTRLAKPTKESATAMDALGISITNSDGSMKPFGTTIDELRTAFSGLSEEQKATYSAMLGGQEAMSGLLAIVNAAPADVEKLTNALNDCNGAAEEMAATMIDNLQGDLTLLGSAFESLQIAISDSLTPTLREFAQFGQKAMAGLLEGFQGGGVSGFMSALSGIVTEGVTMLAEKAPEFASVSVQLVGALGEGFLNAGPQILEAANQVMGTIITGLSGFLSEHGEEMAQFGIGIVNSIFSGFSQAGEVISEHISTFIPLIAEAFLSYHETLFTVGIDILGAIGQGIIDNKDQLQTIASDTITNMVTALRDNAPGIIEGGLALLEALVGAIEENMPLIIETGATIIGKLIEGIATASPGVQAIIGTAVLPHILKIVDTVGKIGGAFTGLIGIVGKVGGAFTSLFSVLAANPIALVVVAIAGLVAAFVGLWNNCEGFRNFWIGLWEGLKSVVSTAIDAIVGFFTGIIDFVKNNWQGLLLMIVNPFAGAFKLIYDNCEAFREFVDGLMEAVGEIFAAGWEAVKGFFVGAWEAVQSAWGAAVDFFAGIGDGIHAAFEAVTGFLGDAFSAAWDAITGVWDAAVGFFSGVWDGISGVFSAVSGWFGDIFSAAWDAVCSAWSGVTDFFGGVWDNIKDVFSNAWEAFSDIGGNIIKGIWDGISGLGGWLWDQVSGFFGGFIDNVKGFFGIHSPSTVFASIGENMVAGMEEGIGDKSGDVDSELANMAQGMIDAFGGLADQYGSIGKVALDTMANAFAIAPKMFTDIGQNAINALSGGLGATITKLQNKVAGLMNGITSAAKAALGIHSPSKVFAGIGENMALGLAEGWSDEYAGIKRQIENGLNFGTATVGLSANYSGAARYGAQEAPQRAGTGWGNTYVTINSPKAVDGVQAAREWQKTAQRMALGYV